MRRKNLQVGDDNNSDNDIFHNLFREDKHQRISVLESKVIKDAHEDDLIRQGSVVPSIKTCKVVDPDIMLNSLNKSTYI